MIQDEEKYKSAARELLEKAQDALAEDGQRQASKQGWGAAAQIVRVVAETRGWRNDDDKHIAKVVSRMAEQMG